ncbi:uncharacterized protein N7503_005592 [Penicillium pulvis]|uniref:uncharacterized protein n=1 Tax=Penicillium pulvis TaxID=1562058 RepID=UPI00254930A7|nr:uncharacterized protein N7503_005592 [Penicillium pulvis]KAJ5803142.1 hypothetical protein N7503_005592 [Penicillium pulvis]
MSSFATQIPEIAEKMKDDEFMANVKEEVAATIERFSSRIQEVVQHLFTHPELAFEEYIAHDTICDFFEDLGFTVKRQAYGVQTAFEVLTGEGGRLVSINAEYDALPLVGHACGHHLIACAGMSAFLSLHFALKKANVKGRVQLLGTPAEESGGGKAALLKGGAYEGVDAALMTHPATQSMVDPNPAVTGLGAINFLATFRITVEFFGRPSHASQSPWEAINANDAAIAAQVNIGLLRQQIRPVDRIHGCMLEGPRAANVIGEYTKLTYMARSPTKKTVTALGKRLTACFQGAALATGCEVKITPETCYDDLVHTKALLERYTQIANAVPGQLVLPINDESGPGSTDFGNVSYAVPGIHAFFVIDAPAGTGPHQHGFAAAAGTQDSFERALTAGSFLALTAMDLLVDDVFFATVKDEWDTNEKIVENKGAIQESAEAIAGQ